MIGFLRGVLVVKKVPSLILDVRGVGYEIDVPMSTFFHLPAVGEEVMLHTHLVVREDAHALFGFLSESERALFRSLIKVSGIGAKLALGVLSGISVEDFHRCVRNGETAALVRLPGIGKKTAERMVIELRDRLPSTFLAEQPPSGNLPSTEISPVQDAISALMALGYKPQEASAMIRSVPTEGLSSEELIRLALQSTARK